MALRSTQTGFGPVTKGFHWLIAILFVTMFAIGWYMDLLPLGLEKLAWISRHKSIGVTILLLVVLRIIWRLAEQTPEGLGEKAWERQAAKLAHFALYAVMLAMPLSGWLMSSAANFSVSVFGLFTLPDLVGPDKALYEQLRFTHWILSWVIVGLVGLHVAAAFKHHFINRDATLRRMLPGTGKGN
ncbi:MULTISPECIES: cytochrome b [Thalassospira]|jgi:cytochrome b561|uniref:Cytochrome B n=1 Tax=Thalassospira xiamenensis TaxID=220697 RepID=A0ABR5Y7R6_9PROT|nr:MULTISPECIES: cytochrome b [Thalassospira]MAL28125.1 cytochrome b [Thalassospira sp.]MBR9781579.1 cytochrome b [Rhodospirillales bacterium]KZD06878.1 cytochrome B [Thalassospira xiamenensis]KZD09166.1 cytochrome B [Thalassospira xiamenensis]MBL4839300.1 cytochrome b [Thalassospira sp.]|tara:strand:+ start:1742 stop:2296 length:555 start_codon:yes stop_codon:yes gene_type:complete